MPTPQSPSRRAALARMAGLTAGAAVAIRSFAQTADKSAAATAAGSSATSARVAAAAALEEPVSLPDYQRHALERMSVPAREYIESGSADETSLQANRDALQRIRLLPRVMVDVSRVDLSVTLLGRKLPHPILLAPTAAHMLVHPAGEVETVKGAGAARAIMVASTSANRSIEDIAAAATHDVWFQLYVPKDRELTKAIIQRAESAGCKALCVTVDLPVVYGRNRVDRVTPDIPPLPVPNIGLGPTSGWKIRSVRSAALNWKDIEWLQSIATIPVLLKGILHPADAEMAVTCGARGIIVSNHGGRALDGVPATIEALPRVTQKVAGRVPVLVDGGIRRGADVLKGLALGATAVLIGRPYLHGLAVNGAEGVRHVVEILRTELESAMALTGKTSISELNASLLWH